MRRFQAGPRDQRTALQVVESRSVGSKSQLLLVTVGTRNLVVGLSPSGMTTLAELAPGDLETAAAAIDATGADGLVPQRSIAARPAMPGVALGFLVPLLAAVPGAIRAVLRPRRSGAQ